MVPRVTRAAGDEAATAIEAMEPLAARMRRLAVFPYPERDWFVAEFEYHEMDMKALLAVGTALHNPEFLEFLAWAYGAYAVEESADSYIGLTFIDGIGERQCHEAGPFGSLEFEHPALEPVTGESDTARSAVSAPNEDPAHDFAGC